MLAVALAGVELDRCGPHGVWFDAGELERVLATLTTPTPLPAPRAAAVDLAAPPHEREGGHRILNGLVEVLGACFEDLDIDV